MQEQEAKDPEREEGQELSPEGEPVLEHGSRLRWDGGFGGHKNLEQESLRIQQKFAPGADTIS